MHKACSELLWLLLLVEMGNLAAKPANSAPHGHTEDPQRLWKPLKLFWQERLGFDDGEEWDSIPNSQDSVPEYMTTLYDMAEAAIEQGDNSLPWLSQEKTILAIPAKTVLRSHNAASFVIKAGAKHLQNYFDGVELVLPTMYGVAHGIHKAALICATGSACISVQANRRDLVSKSWLAYNVTSLVSWKSLPGIIKLNVALNSPRRISQFHNTFTDVNDVKEGPLLVLYAHFPGHRRLAAAFKHYREHLLNHAPDEGPETTRIRRSRRDTAAQEDSDHCVFHEWSVSMVDLGWDQRIIRPETFNANYCSGRCPEDLDEISVRHTNHAYIKNVYRSRHANSTMPPAYCVPVRLETVSFLFRMDGATTYKSFVEIRARECGCV